MGGFGKQHRSREEEGLALDSAEHGGKEMLEEAFSLGAGGWALK